MTRRYVLSSWIAQRKLARRLSASASVMRVMLGAMLVCLGCSHRQAPMNTRVSAAPTLEVCGIRVPLDVDRLTCWPAAERDYPAVAQLHNLKTLDLQNSDITESAIAALQALPSLEHLLLSSPRPGQINDTLLARLDRLGRLKTLHIPHSAVTDAGVRAIARMFPDLEELGLCMTAVTNLGLKYLALLPRLRTVLLCGRSFTPEALEALSGVRSLRRIELAYTGIEREDALRFARERPATEVLWSALPLMELELLK